jgi:hypothetical protein
MILEKYEQYWQPEPNSGCYIWLGYLRGGHNSFRPCIRYYGRNTFICRIICEETYGPPPTSKHQAAHKPPCNNNICVNPAHLYWATPAQNAEDMVRMCNEYRYKSGASSTISARK